MKIHIRMSWYFLRGSLRWSVFTPTRVKSVLDNRPLLFHSYLNWDNPFLWFKGLLFWKSTSKRVLRWENTAGTFYSFLPPESIKDHSNITPLRYLTRHNPALFPTRERAGGFNTVETFTITSWWTRFIRKQVINVCKKSVGVCVRRPRGGEVRVQPRRGNEDLTRSWLQFV